MKKWRSCNKCSGMFFDGRDHKGTCPAEQGHVAQGLEFNLPHGGADNGHAQGAWRFCNRCFGMVFDGSAAKGHCPAGGVHVAQGFVFVLPTTSVVLDDG